MSAEKERSKDVIIDEGNINFESLFLSPPILQALKENNFFKPSPIQLKAVPLGKCGLDLIVKSKSGTGKTAVFAIISLEMINATLENLQVLILAPTREIAVQSCDVISTLGKNLNGLKVEHFIGGLPLKEDTAKAKGCHIAVGSPGRILHLITSSTLDISKVKLFVLDEADSLMENNFQTDINKIFHQLPKNKQMLALSATFPHELDTFLANYMHIPTHVTATMDTPLLLGLKHFVTITSFNTNVIFFTKFKNTELLRLLKNISFTQCLIFCNYQTRAEEVSNFLNNNDWTTEFISGAQTQKQRLEVLKKLKGFQVRILLSTDLTARGIDAVNVDLVINYDVPNDESTYLHRMGRAGRYGAKGLCISIASKGQEVEKFEGIIGAIGGTEMTVPILPKNLPENIWEADVSGFQILRGVKSNSTNKNDILKSVETILRDFNTQDVEADSLTVETTKSKDTNKKKKKKKSNNKVNDTKMEMETNVEENDDALSLLQQLAAGKAPVEPETKDNSAIFNKNVSLFTVSGLLDDDNFDVDENQTKTIENFITSFKDSDSVVSEFSSLSNCTSIINEKEMQQDKTLLSAKTDQLSASNTNISLMAVSELLEDDNFDDDVDNSQTKCVETFIANLKSDFVQFEEESSETTDTSQKLLGDLEDVFKHAFNYAIDKSKPNWADLYNYQPVEEEKADTKVNLLQDLLEYCENEENPEFEDYEDEEYVDDDDYDAEVEEQIQPTMEWIPVTSCTVDKTEVIAVQSAPKEIVTSQGSQNVGGGYEGIYEAAVQQLEADFNTLESHEAFEKLWWQWQGQLSAVRDYVQQNIYLSEMSAYRDGLRK